MVSGGKTSRKIRRTIEQLVGQMLYRIIGLGVNSNHREFPLVYLTLRSLGHRRAVQVVGVDSCERARSCNHTRTIKVSPSGEVVDP